MTQTLGLGTAQQWMFVLLALMGLALLYVIVLGLRRRIIFKMGVRNIARRRTQTGLIILGLTLSTVIIVSALSIGDTLTYSVRRHAINAFGEIDQVISPPLLSALAGFAADSGPGDDPAAALADTELAGLLDGDILSILTLLQDGLPGISEERYAQMRDEAQSNPATAALVDGLAPSIAFPTILRDRTSGQGIPLGFIVAVDNEYDEQFGLTTVEGEPVRMEDLRTGVGNIFAQASNLFRWADSVGINVDNGAAAIAQAGALLTQGQDLLNQFTQPTPAPGTDPVVEPTVQPTAPPPSEPTTAPTKQAAAQPTLEPTAQSTNQPINTPTVQPTPQSPLPTPQSPLPQTLDLSAIGLGTIDLGALSGTVLTDTFD
ncbi:MAG: hypothetical protein KAZ38_18980, partial [Caldilineaceae bacterium]|nr:hypothetical protein [Caldilineaceae bacterium]